MITKNVFYFHPPLPTTNIFKGSLSQLDKRKDATGAADGLGTAHYVGEDEGKALYEMWLLLKSTAASNKTNEAE